MVEEPRAEVTRVRIWDLPVRLIHWSLAALFAVQWWTGKTGRLEWHRWAGCALLGLIVFRVLWGVFGSSTARFASFVRGPAAVVAYARKLARSGAGDFRVGHNPLGGWSVVLMLLLMSAQIGLGLFSVDVDGLEPGPLTSHVSFAAGRAAAHLHALVFNLLLATVATHVLAAVLHLLIRRDNLIGPMITGARTGETRDPPMTSAGPLRLALTGGAGLAGALWVLRGCPPF